MTPLNTKKNITPPHITPIKNSQQWTPKEISFILNALEMGKICIDCQSTSASQWGKKKSLDGSPSQDQCNKCYATAKSVLAKSGILGKTCVDCQSTSTPQWYKKTSLDVTLSQDQCGKCYQAAKRSFKRKEDDISISNQNKASKIDFISKKGEV